MKIWTSTMKGDDKVIAFFDGMIYKANPKNNEIESYVFDLKTNKNSALGFFTIPVGYISEINMTQGKNYLEILFRGDYEHLKINDSKIKSEVFNFFKENIPNTSYASVTESKIMYAKKPLIALTVILIAFLWSFFIAKGMEQGNEYDVYGQHYDSFAGIILVLANLGVTNLCLLFGSLFLIAGIRLFRKLKYPLSKQVIYFQR